MALSTVFGRKTFEDLEGKFSDPLAFRNKIQDDISIIFEEVIAEHVEQALRGELHPGAARRASVRAIMLRLYDEGIL